MRKLPVFFAALVLFGSLIALKLAGAKVPWITAKAATTAPGKGLGHEGKEIEKEDDGPDRAFEWRMKAWRDERGFIPKDGLYKARLQREANVSYWRQGHVRPMVDQWTSIGPTNISGRLMGIAVDPRNKNNVFAASAGGGLWHSTDQGAHWAPINDRWKSIAMGTVTMAPSNPNIIFAGTGEGAYNLDAIDGAGIYKSNDGGTNWNLLPSTTTFVTTNTIAVHPTNQGVILAGTRPGGIQRSVDGGGTWSNVYSAQGCFDIHFSNQNGNNAIAEVMDNNNAHHALYSTDAGATWQEASGLNAGDFSSRIGLSYAASDNTIVYAYVGTYQGQPVGDANGQRGDVYKSTDGGHSFSLVSSPSGNGQTWYTIPIWVDPTNPSTLMIGGLNCSRSVDGGATWTTISDWTSTPTSPHADQHFFLGDPGFNGTTDKTVYVATDGGLYRTDNIYNVSQYNLWVSMINNQVSTQYYSAAGDANTGYIIGGLQDNGSLYSNSANTLSSLQSGGDGGFCAMDPTDPNYAYGEYVYLTIHRSTKNGAYAQDIYTGIGDAYVSNYANFIAPFILSPSDPNVMWAGGYDLWRSTNVKASAPNWVSVRAGTGTDIYGYPDLIASVAEAPSNKNVVWIGTNSGRIYKTSNALAPTPTWTTINDGASVTPLPNRYCGRIMIDKDNENIVYTAFGGYNSDNLWKSVDGGSHWTVITGSGVTALPAAPIHCVVRHPTQPSYLYVATEVGVFNSTDGGATWSGSDYGPANVCTYELSFLNHSNNVLLAATHGRGLWTSIVGGGTGVSSLSLASNSVVAGNSVLATVKLSKVAPSGGVTVTLSSNNPAITVQPSVLVLAGSDTATFNVNSSGVDASTNGNVTASAGGVSLSQPLTVTPATLASVSVAPSPVEGGLTTTATLHLNGAAGPSGLTVNLTSSSASATLAASTSVSAGASSKAVTVTTKGVSASTNATIGAQVGSGTTYSAVLTIVPTTIQSISVSPSPVAGGAQATVTVVLNGTSAPTGTNVVFHDTSGDAGLPASRILPGNVHGYSFPVTTKPVTAQVVATLSATTGAVTKQTTLTITTPAVASLALNASKTTYGGTPVTATVTLTGPAQPGGVTVSLGASSTSVSIPTTVQVLAGATSANYTVMTKGVDTALNVTLSAKTGSTIVYANLTIAKSVPSTVTFTPTSVIGGFGATGVVRLTGNAGPSGLTVNLTSPSAAVHAPATMFFPANSTSATFVVTTSGVNTTTNGVVRAQTGVGTYVQGSLTVTPAIIAQLLVSPTSVHGGTSVTGLIKLTGQAGPGGTTVNLSSDNTHVNLPGSVLVPSGTSSFSFTIPTTAVSASSTAHLGASLRGVTVNANLGLVP